MASGREQAWRYTPAELLQLREQASSQVPCAAAGIVAEPSTEVLFSSRGRSLAGHPAPTGRGKGLPPSRQDSSREPARTPTHQQHASSWTKPQGKRGGVPGLSHHGEEAADWGEEEGTDSEEENPQYKAFYVEGEPDFSIQDPDAEEYLKRVRWEARRCPRVVVAAPTPHPPAPHAQTAYLPQLLGVAPCPPHLLPDPTWETSFLADFSDLRTELVQLFALVAQGAADAGAGPLLPSAGTPLPPLRDAGAWKRFCSGQSQEGQQTQGEHHSGATSGNEQRAGESGDGRQDEREGAEMQKEGGPESNGQRHIQPRFGRSEVDHPGTGHEGLNERGLLETSALDADEDEMQPGQLAGTTPAPASPSGDTDLRTAEWIHVAGPAPGGTSGPQLQMEGHSCEAHAAGSLHAGDAPEVSDSYEVALTAPSALPAPEAASHEGHSDEHGESGTRAGATSDAPGVLSEEAGVQMEEIESGALQRRSRRRGEKRGPLLEEVLPFLGILLKFDEMTTALHLRYHVRWLHDLPSTLPLDWPRTAWLFALCAAVSKPLDADTMAALRDLLRCCASRRASKVSAADPELAFLNILVVIAGRYFGQQER